MDEQRLAEIEKYARAMIDHGNLGALAGGMVPELIAEVRRLRAENLDLALKVVERMPNRWFDGKGPLRSTATWKPSMGADEVCPIHKVREYGVCPERREQHLHAEQM